MSQAHLCSGPMPGRWSASASSRRGSVPSSSVPTRRVSPSPRSGASACYFASSRPRSAARSLLTWAPTSCPTSVSAMSSIESIVGRAVIHRWRFSSLPSFRRHRAGSVSRSRSTTGSSARLTKVASATRLRPAQYESRADHERPCCCACIVRCSLTTSSDITSRPTGMSCCGQASFATNWKSTGCCASAIRSTSGRWMWNGSTRTWLRCPASDERKRDANARPAFGTSRSSCRLRATSLSIGRGRCWQSTR